MQLAIRKTMIKKTVFLTILFLLTATFVINISGQETPKKVLKTIVIDPGHGGIDHGAKGIFSTEAQVSLDVSLKLGKAIEKEFPDIKIVYTRTTDVVPGGGTKDEGLRYRADLANRSGGDLFIAIHCNAAPPISHREFTGYKTATVYVGKGKKRRKVTKKVRQYRYWYTQNPAIGTETYIWASSKTDAKVNSMAKNNDYYGEIDSTSTISVPDPSDPVEKARMLIYTQNYFRKSLMFADLIEKGFQAQGRTYRGGVKQRNDKGIWVLQATGMPSILIEIGFISNKEEEEYINSENGQNEIVSNIMSALKNYKHSLESKALPAEGQKKPF